MNPRHSPSPSIRRRARSRNRSHLTVLTFAICALCLLSACGFQQQQAELEQREAVVEQREQATAQLEQQLQRLRFEVDEREALLNEITELQRDLQLRLEERELRLEQQEQEIEQRRQQVTEELEAAQQLRQRLEARVRRGPAPAITGRRAIVVDASSGEVLFDKNADQRGPVASTQKLLTALLIIERGSLDSEFDIVAEDTRAAPTRLGLEVGERFSRRNLVTSLLVRSYNDVAEALARDHSGSVAAFCEAMNRRAVELGMTDSHFANPHGLPNDSQYSTARDLARLALHVDREPELREMIKLHHFTLERPDGREVALTNTNRVLRGHDWCDGMKTGFTRASGFCLVASGEHEGRRCIVVVLNSTSGAVWEDTRKLLAWAIEV